MSASSVVTRATDCLKLSEHGGRERPTEADVAIGAQQLATLDARKVDGLKASMRHFMSRRPGEAIRNGASNLDYSKMLPLWLDQSAKRKETGVKKVKAAARTRPPTLPKYCVRLGEMAGVEPSIVHLIFEKLRSLAVEALQQMKRFVLPGIATFSRKSARSVAGSKRIGGAVFEAKAVPAAHRARCTAPLELQRSVFTATPDAPTAPSPAWKLFCERLSASAGMTSVTSEIVGAVMKELRGTIIQDLRTQGRFLLDGFMTFKTTEVPARHAEFIYNASLGKTVLHRAKRPRQCVHGRVHARLQQAFVESRTKGLKKRTFIRRAVELRQFGFTEGCPGCEAAAKGARELGHSETCRRRIEAKMLDDEISALLMERAKIRWGQADGAGSTARQAVRTTSAKAEIILLTRVAAASALASAAGAEQASGRRLRRRHKGP